MCDASMYDVGTILFHKIRRDEKPIAQASRALSKAEQGYARIEKEALAVVFGMKKFHKYLFGRSFVIYSDHQPLATLLAHGKPVPVMAAARMQRRALLPEAYKYKCMYRKDNNLGNADALSRLPLLNDRNASDYVQFFSVVNDLLLPAEAIRKRTSTAPYSTAWTCFCSGTRTTRPQQRGKRQVNCSCRWSPHSPDCATPRPRERYRRTFFQTKEPSRRQKRAVEGIRGDRKCSAPRLSSRCAQVITWGHRNEVQCYYVDCA